MPTIIEAIDGTGPLWFPGLADTLAAYNDARGRSPQADTTCRDEIPKCSGGIQIGKRIALLKDKETDKATTVTDLLGHWRDGDKSSVVSALLLLDRIDGLTSNLAPLVRAIHRLESDPDYDISHSDPELPYSIFVSIPPAGPTATIRLAESILHEAMHLQLSLIEREVRLVADNSREGWSPWQACKRPPQGLLHGLYVFAVLFDVLKRLDHSSNMSPEGDSSATTEKAVSDHLRRRLQQIAEEVAELPDFAETLEPCGKRLRRRCIETVLSKI